MKWQPGRAVLDKGEMNNREIRFQVEFSARESYQVTFNQRDNGNITATCTCPDWGAFQSCEHGPAILTGEADGIVSGNTGEVPIVCSWASGGEAGIWLVNYAVAKLAHDSESVEIAKKQLARTLTEGLRVEEDRGDGEVIL